MGYAPGFLFDIIILCTLMLAQWRISRMVLQRAGSRGSPRVRWIRAFLLAGGALIAAGILLSFPRVAEQDLLPNGLSAWLRAAANLWAFSSTGAYIVYVVVSAAGKRLPSPPVNPGRRRWMRMAGGALIGAPFAVTGYGVFVERTNFRVREIDIPFAGLPEELTGLRMVQLSDIHLSLFLSERELAKVIDAANEARAHLALVTGDLISQHGDPLDACLRQLSRLRTDAGTLGCLGNHEIYAEAEDYATEEGARLGIRFLRNAAQQLRFGKAVLNFAGVDYQRIGWKKTYLRGAERLVAPGALNVLLSHNPDVFPVAAHKGYDLTLSGHTHGGQVAVEILHQSISLARFFTPFVYGCYRMRGLHGPSCVYVTRGIGTIGMPARVGAPPEITVLRLKKA